MDERKKSTRSVTEGSVVSYSLCAYIFYLSFANGSGNYKLIECKGDSSVACTSDRFIFFLFFFRCFFFWPLATNSTKYISGKRNRKCQPKRVPESSSNEIKHYMICSTTKLIYNVLQIRVANCLCSIASKVVLKEEWCST